MKKQLLILLIVLSNFGFTQTRLSHSTNQNIWNTGPASCSTSGSGTIQNNSFIRVFDTDNFNVQDTVFFVHIEMGVNATSGGAYDLIGRIHELNGILQFANMSLIAADTAAVFPDSTIYKMIIPIKDGYALPGDTIVTEVFAALNASIIFYPGSNPYPETDSSYIAASGCGIPEPVTFESIAFTTTKLVLNLWVNHRPEMNDLTFNVFKDNVLALNNTDFNTAMNDFDNDTVGMIQILTLPANGIIENNGNAISIGDTVLNTELDLMTYTPNSSYFGNDSFDFRVRDNSHWALDSTTLNVTVMNWQLAVGENEKSDFIIYPNPTNSTFEIKSKEKIELIQLYNSTGKLLETYDTFTHSIDVSTYSTGTYFVALTTDKNFLVQKLIKE